MTFSQSLQWAFNWKMLFNPDSSKLAQEVLFSRKKKIQVQPTPNLNDVQLRHNLPRKSLAIIYKAF